MTTTDYSHTAKSGSGAAIWLGFFLLIVLVLGGVLSIVAYQQNDLTLAEALAAGFIGVGGIFIGLIGGLVGLVIGLFGAVIGIVAAGGAIALTAFLIGSPIIAIILFVLLMRRDKGCPDPSAHGDY